MQIMASPGLGTVRLLASYVLEDKFCGLLLYVGGSVL